MDPVVIDVDGHVWEPDEAWEEHLDLGGVVTIPLPGSVEGGRVEIRDAAAPT
jgi:hypothetical protein